MGWLPPSRGRLVEPGRWAGDCRAVSAILACLRAVSVITLLTAVLALGAAPSLSAQGQASSWVFDYVNFVTRSDGWAMATNEGALNSSIELLTSHDGGRRWHDVTPPVVLAGEDAETDNPDSVGPDLTPFILSGRDAWLAVGQSHPQSSELELFMTSDAGRRWVLRGRFHGADLTATELPGAAVSGGAVVRYRNLSRHACTLSGYPAVVGLVSPTGPAEAAVDVVSTAFGGWQPYHLGVTEPLPTVVVRANGAKASSVVEFVSTGSAQTPCPSGHLPLWFRSLWLDVPGGTRPFALALSSIAITMIVCSHFVTTPIVPGTTGGALQVPH